MGKFSKTLLAMAAATALATPAFAITADMTGSLQLRGFASENLIDGNDSRNDENKFFDQRFRLFTNTALHEDVKAVFAIEVDNVWGETVGKPSTDEKGAIEVKNLYLDFNIPQCNTNVKGGSQYFKHGGGLIIAEDAAGLQVRYTPVKGQSVLLSYIKADEDLAQSEGDDSNYYHLQYDADLAGWRLSPFVAFLDGQPTGGDVAAQTDDFEGWYGGLEASGKVGPVSLAGTAIYNSWDNNENGADAENNETLALWARAAFTTGGTTLSAEAAKYGDDKAGAFVNVRGYNNFSEIVTGGRFDTRNGTGYPGSQQFVGTAVGANPSYYMNFKYYKLGIEQKLSDAHKISAYYVYTKQAEAPNAEKINFGHEIDAYYDYVISKGLTFTIGGGYLFADDELDNVSYNWAGTTPASTIDVGEDDIWKLGTALTYNF